MLMHKSILPVKTDPEVSNTPTAYETTVSFSIDFPAPELFSLNVTNAFLSALQSKLHKEMINEVISIRLG